MFGIDVIFLAILLYMAVLFAIAFWAGGSSRLALRLSGSPVVYSLSIAVYCTSWTYFGSVGNAATSGLSFLAVYIGPTLAIALWWPVLKKLVIIKDQFRITSIADFISARYEKSQSLAVLATTIALVGTMPYIALQIKAIKTSIDILHSPQTQFGVWVAGHSGPLIVVMLTLFTILFGVRNVDPTERHRGMITAVAFESLVKLFAFMLLGVFIVFFLHDGIGDMFQADILQRTELHDLYSLGLKGQSYMTWSTVLVLSMSAIMFLPRQFHVAVIENPHRSAIPTAIWLFPLYMLLINLFVAPIAQEGILSGIPLSMADSYVLRIPLLHDMHWLSLLIFIGGFSAATSMVMISAMTMSTMTVNHLLLPLFGRYSFCAPLRRHLLRWKWLAVAMVITIGYWFELQLGDSYALVNMGLISFAAALQFAPAVIGGIFWKTANRSAAFWGLLAGFGIWTYTLLLPALAKSGFLDQGFIANGPFGIGLLKPEALFNMHGLPPLTHTAIWSMTLNIGLYVLLSLFRSQSESEHQIASEFVDAEQFQDESDAGESHICEVLLEDKNRKMRILLRDYFDDENVEKIIQKAMTDCGLTGHECTSLTQFSEYHRTVEHLLAGAIGSAMAHSALRKHDVLTRKERQRLSDIYKDMLANLVVSPRELARRVDFYREREEMLRSHGHELEKRIAEKESEIQARTKAEAALMKAEERYRNIFNNAMDGIFQSTLEGRFVIANQALARILGYPTPEALMESITDIASQLYVDPTRRDEFIRQIKSDHIVNNFEVELYNSIGGRIWVSLHARPLHDQDGNIIYIEGVLSDITTRRMAEDALQQHQDHLEEEVRQRTQEVRDNEMLLQTVLDGIEAAVIIVDAVSNRILDCNNNAEKLIRTSRDNIISTDCSNLFSHHACPHEGKELGVEMVLTLHDGTKIPILKNVLPVVYKGQPAFASILFDITERKNLESKLNVAQKLQSIGQLAAGVAHEINTPIQYVGDNIKFLADSFQKLQGLNRNYLDLLAKAKDHREFESDTACITDVINDIDLNFLLEEIPQAIEQSLGGVEQVATIVRSLKQFSHPDQDSIKSININTSLRQTTIVAKNEWKYVADVELDLDEEAPTVSGYPGPLNQVFLNILVNAAHAVGEQVKESGNKGTITISTRVENEFLVIRFTDTGAGIAPENIERVFDPFFTTKEVGRGTGQGLSIAYTIITEKHHGSIQVESKLNAGTTFTIRLPLESEITEG